MTKETRQFQAEVKEILDLMVHSLYSNREIFLRELISNASDALDRLRFEELSNGDLASSEEGRHIRLIPNEEEKTLIITDNGIGMTFDELIENIGTIAHSGTKKFMQKARELKEHPELIGQFGVGFYSSFMVADRVIVHTQRVGTNDGVVWESTGDGTYTIDHVPRPEGHGTTITLHLKKIEADEEESSRDYTKEWTLRSVVKKYSDFIAYPIMLKTKRSEPKKDDKGEDIKGETVEVEEDQTLNSQKALWLRPVSDIKEDEYREFYKHLTSDWMDPLETIHYQAEGTHEFSSLMYVPAIVPMDYNQRQAKIGLSLYVKRVFITENCEELLPIYMRFVKGVVDSSDLPLNVSREILQKDRQIVQIRKALTGKILKHFKTLLESDREKYEKFWEKFGPTLKEGIPSDYTNKEKIEKLALFNSTHSDKLTTLDEYVSRMKSEQKDIYYMVGESLTQMRTSPYLEKLQKKGYEVLLFIDPVDEFVARSMTTYQEKPVVSITQEKLELDTEEEKKEKEIELTNKKKKFEQVTKTIQAALDENVKEVRISDRLIDSPVCLVSGADDPGAYMARMMESMGQAMPKAKRIMEINPDHPLFEKMLTSTEEKQKTWAEILYCQALLNEGTALDNPTKFTKQVAELMVSTNL